MSKNKNATKQSESKTLSKTKKNKASKLKIIVSQLKLSIGALIENSNNIIAAIEKAKKNYQADLLIFPELCVTGYPPEDLLLREDFLRAIDNSVTKIISAVKDISVIISFPYQDTDGKLYNSAALVQNGKIVGLYHKQLLPNYSVFDEKRYFTPGTEPFIFKLKGVAIGILICEDIWFPDGPVQQTKEAGAQLIVSINASPFSIDKAETRKNILRSRAIESGLPIIYAHNVGAQDELVFDGGSMVVNATGELCCQAKFFAEDFLEVDITINENNVIDIVKQAIPRVISDEQLIYDAIILGLSTYVNSSGFKGALVGISGGIDSALTLAIAVDALGKDNVEAVLLPSRFTSQQSIEDAKKEAEILGVKCREINIEEPFALFTELVNEKIPGNNLEDNIHEHDISITAQNIQARIRALILMAISNQTNKLLLTTGNKSEMAVGYATLYGDMAGSFAPIKDVLKGMVYRLAKYRNTLSDSFVIPRRVIDRPPSAELAPNQKDTDFLPPYDVLDGILRRYVEQDQGLEQIIAAGYKPDTVAQVIKMVDKNEYKRRQAAPGVKISQKAFGRDRRYPIVSKY